MIRHILLMLSALCFTPPLLAQSCDSANRYKFDFSSRPAATLSYGSTYNYTATNGGGATRPFSVQIAQNGLSSSLAGGNQMPEISTLVTGPDSTKRTLVIGGVFGSRTTDILSSTRVISVTFSFSTPLREFGLTVHDVDFASNQFRDWLAVSGSNGSTSYTGSLALGSVANSAAVGPTSTPVAISAGQAVGSGTSTNNSGDGTIIASFAQPVTSITMKYGNYPLRTGETSTGQQAMGIEGFSFCPMPSVSMTKNSAPASSAFGAFNLPETDVIYTLTVQNTGGSTVDPGTVMLSDVLPPNVTFKNTAYDSTTSLPVKLIGSAGVTISAADVTFRRTGTSNFNYTPLNGYDPLVAEIRIAPNGGLAANSSFAVQFKAKIN